MAKEKIVEAMKTNKLNYPSATDWMWNYCTYLGPWEDKNGKKFDLGIHLNDNKFQPFSNATVYGHEPGEYLSGPLNVFVNDMTKEVVKRAKALRLIPEDWDQSKR